MYAFAAICIGHSNPTIQNQNALETFTNIRNCSAWVNENHPCSWDCTLCHLLLLLSKFVVFHSHPCDLWLCFSLKVELISLENSRSKQRIRGSIFLPTWLSWLWMLVIYSLLTALCGDIFLTLKVWHVSWRFFNKICIYSYIFLAWNVFLVVGYCQENYKNKNTKMSSFSAE